jgi:hypothetical protein
MTSDASMILPTPKAYNGWHGPEAQGRDLFLRLELTPRGGLCLDGGGPTDDDDDDTANQPATGTLTGGSSRAEGGSSF